MRNTSPAHEKLDSLQLLRGIAAALVVYVHAQETFKDKVSPTLIYDTTLGLGELGVKIFFCISGFIIFDSIRNLKSGGISAATFLKKRLIRIIPLYWVATLIYSIKQTFVGAPPTWQEVTRSLAFIPYSNADGLMRPVIGAGWTLNYEMFFYCITAVTLLAPSKVRAASLFIIIGPLVIINETHSSGKSTILPQTLSLITSEYLLFFLAGIFCSIASKSPEINNRKSTSLAALMLPLPLVAAFICAGYFLLPGHTQSTPVDLVFCIVCVLASTFYRTSAQLTIANPMTDRWRKTCSLVGDGSYSTYLTHGFVMGPCARLLSFANVDIPVAVFSSCMVIACTAVGVFLFLNLEKPIQRALTRNFLSSRSANKAIC